MESSGRQADAVPTAGWSWMAYLASQHRQVEYPCLAAQGDKAAVARLLAVEQALAQGLRFPERQTCGNWKMLARLTNVASHLIDASWVCAYRCFWTCLRRSCLGRFVWLMVSSPGHIVSAMDGWSWLESPLLCVTKYLCVLLCLLFSWEWTSGVVGDEYVPKGREELGLARWPWWMWC
jgi:hypothetical protein